MITTHCDAEDLLHVETVAIHQGDRRLVRFGADFAHSKILTYVTSNEAAGIANAWMRIAVELADDSTTDDIDHGAPVPCYATVVDLTDPDEVEAWWRSLDTVKPAAA